MSLPLKVTSFHLVIFCIKLIVGKPPIPKTLAPHKVGKLLVVESWESDIPNLILSQTKALILDCLMEDYHPRLLFSDVFDRIEEMKFKLMPEGIQFIQTR
jgi:hypothetical protein